MPCGAHEQKAADASLTTQRYSQARWGSLLWPRENSAAQLHVGALFAMGTCLVFPGFALPYNDQILPKLLPVGSHMGFQNKQDRDSSWEPAWPAMATALSILCFTGLGCPGYLWLLPPASKNATLFGLQLPVVPIMSLHKLIGSVAI